MNKYLLETINETEIGLNKGGIPIGSVLVYKGEVIEREYNQRIQKKSVTLNGEFDALENARQPASVYQECVLYSALSPCPMCSGGLLLFGLQKVVIGENDTFTGEEKLLQERGGEVEVANNN